MDEASADRLTIENRLARKILVCAGGSIGAAFLPTAIVHFQLAIPEAKLRMVMTSRAATIVPSSTFAALLKSEVLCDWADGSPTNIAHIALVDWAELLLVMPATANLIGKTAAGIADDLVTSCLVAAECPVVFVPSMNQRMWQNPIVQRNVNSLRELGRYVLEPAEGIEGSSGRTALGALPPIRDLMIELMKILS